MHVLAVILFYAAVLWLALMSFGLLRPRASGTAPRERAIDVDPRSPHTVFERALAHGDGLPVELTPEAHERAWQSALAVAARRPELLHAIGHVIADLEPTSADEVDVIVESTVASVEGGAIGPGAAEAGVWHPVRVRAFVEAHTRHRHPCFYLPAGWDGPWRYLECVTERRRAGWRNAKTYSLAPIALDPAAFSRAPPGTPARPVAASFEGREHIVERIALRVEGPAEAAVELRQRLAEVACGVAAALLADPLPEGMVTAIRIGNDVETDLPSAHLSHRHRIERDGDGEDDACLGEIVLTRRTPGSGA